MRKILPLALLVLVSGCASIAGEKLQPISVKTMQDGKEIPGVNCSLKNDAGSWSVTTPNSVIVHKSTGDMSVDCNKDVAIAGHETLVSKSNGVVWGNILIGGGIGYIVDRNTGAGFDYPNEVTVTLRKLGEFIGLSTSTSTTVTAKKD